MFLCLLLWAAQAVGVAWLRALCARDARDPAAVFQEAVARHVPDGLKGPFNDAGELPHSTFLHRRGPFVACHVIPG